MVEISVYSDAYLEGKFCAYQDTVLVFIQVEHINHSYD